MNKSCGNGEGSFEIDGISDTTEIPNMKVTRTWKGGDLSWERESEVEDKA